MEQDNLTQIEEQMQQKSIVNTVTPLSKYLAMVLFIVLPFIGGWIGYQYAPEKMVEVEKVVYKEVNVDNVVDDSNNVVNQPEQEVDNVMEPSISVVGYENSEPLSSIKVSYKNLPDNASALALCLPNRGGCTEWVDSFTPTGQDGVHSMTTTKNLGDGEYIIVVIGDEFSDQIVASEPFVIDLEGSGTQTRINWATFEIEDTVNPSAINEIKWKYNANIFSALPAEKTYALFAVVDSEGTVVNSSVVGDGVSIGHSINSVTWGGSSGFVPAEDMYSMLEDGEEYRYKVILGYAAEPNENNSFKELAANHISWSEWFIVDWNN